MWLTLAVLALILAAGAVWVRVLIGPRFDGLVILAACGSALILALRIPSRTAAAESAPGAGAANRALKELLESAGPAVVSIGLDGQLTYVNPAAERLMGCDAAQLMQEWSINEFLPPGEASRLVTEMQKLTGIQRPPESTRAGRFAAYLDCVRTLPPSQVPSFDAQIRRRNGETLPVTLHISALRSEEGAIAGLVAVAIDQSATLRQEQDLRESAERYRDLFENSTEMIATLSPAGRFLYVNPAWKRCFGLDMTALLALERFDEIFEAGRRSEVAALFRRVLEGETIDRSPLRHHAEDGRLLELELSMSQRQKAGNPLAVRCLLRDVTQQKQREHRLALQLVVSQIVGENASPEVASMRILEALCISQGWDLAIKWSVTGKDDRLEFSTAWGAPGNQAEELIQESMAETLDRGVELPGRAWKQGRPVWISDLNSIPASPRRQAALSKGMVSGWAVPVRVGSNVLAVLEFYSSYRLREDRESMAAIETAASSLGQMLARSQEQGRAEELYRQQEILLDSVADGICGVDRQGLVTFVNPAAARLLGAEAPLLTGKPVHDVLHGSASASRKCEEDCALLRAATRHTASIGEESIFRADGSSFPAEYAMTPILDQGHFSGSVLSFRDISQRTALDRMKDEFISTVSHELRTPLTSIRGALGLLSSGMLGELNSKAANLMRIAQTNSDRLVRLINDILDLERIQSGREPLTFKPVHLLDIVKQAIRDIQPVADAAGVRLIHDTTQAEIEADPDRLLQVLTNLLSNAVKFSPPNSTVSIMLRPGVTGVTLSVIDHGRGIPADKLEVIFGRFQQVDASDSRQKGGSGLGLAICRTIVLQHSGRIWAERNPVRGSTFRVYLPYHPVPLDSPAGPPEEEPGQGTVLLAGSNADARLSVASQLARHGYRVVESATEEQTVSAAHDGVEAILLDTSIDGMNGWEVLPKLRRVEPEAHTPVVLLSVDAAATADAPPAGPSADRDGTGALQLHEAKPVEEEQILGDLAGSLCAPGEKARVLVVEDDHDLASVIGGVFARDSISVQLAYTLEQALDACFTFRPHLLVLDIGLPDGDGFNVVDWLRQHESLARTPLVVYSGRDLSLLEQRQLTLGPTHFLSKARVQPKQLEALVLTMLRSSSQMEETSPQS